MRSTSNESRAQAPAELLANALALFDGGQHIVDRLRVDVLGVDVRRRGRSGLSALLPLFVLVHQLGEVEVLVAKRLGGVGCTSVHQCMHATCG